GEDEQFVFFARRQVHGCVVTTELQRAARILRRQVLQILGTTDSRPRSVGLKRVQTCVSASRTGSACCASARHTRTSSTRLNATSTFCGARSRARSISSRVAGYASSVPIAVKPLSPHAAVRASLPPSILK